MREKSHGFFFCNWKMFQCLFISFAKFTLPKVNINTPLVYMKSLIRFPSFCLLYLYSLQILVSEYCRLRLLINGMAFEIHRSAHIPKIFNPKWTLLIHRLIDPYIRVPFTSNLKIHFSTAPNQTSLAFLFQDLLADIIPFNEQ